MGPTTSIAAVLPSTRAWAVHDAMASRRIERAALAAQSAAAPHALMQRAGLAVARLALAVAPRSRTVWVAAGPGNNGGDGLVAARHLHQSGRRVRVSLLGDAQGLPADARDALEQARSAGVAIETALPASLHADLALDALLGLGASRPPQGPIAAAIDLLNGCGAPLVAVDLPTGLAADSGRLLGAAAVRATHTVSLLTLKPGLFTGQGRDCAGRIWLATLGVEAPQADASALLCGPPTLRARRHGQHKGSFGDVWVVGGAPGLGGAALLAARAALTAGAGRVYLVRLDAAAAEVDPQRPELMPRTAAQALQPSLLAQASVVCGCGGGDAVRDALPAVLHHAARLVLDADALNAIAAEPALARALRARSARALPSVLTPHPLEAARLLGCSSAEVQADRLGSARMLAERLQCSVVLKGSGTVLAAPGRRCAINPTGNARLASAGTGDVLAGWLGGSWAQCSASDGFETACGAVWLHGSAAESGHACLPLRAGDLIDAMAAALPPVSAPGPTTWAARPSIGQATPGTAPRLPER